MGGHPRIHHHPPHHRPRHHRQAPCARESASPPTRWAGTGSVPSRKQRSAVCRFTPTDSAQSARFTTPIQEHLRTLNTLNTQQFAPLDSRG
jgi:hypothetical protein